MFTCKAISSPSYYVSGAESSRYSYYYADDIPNGIWWLPSATGAEAAFGLQNGVAVEAGMFQQLCAGTLPDGRAVARSDGIRRPAYDLQFAAPKSVSILALLGHEALAAQVIEAHNRAVRRALASISKHGWLQARRGKGGQHREHATFCAAVFLHFTSREDDPQLHSHCVVPNLAIRRDGTIGAMDNRTVLKFQRLVGALYRAELASELKILGFEIFAKDKAFELASVPEEVCAHFSKRRRQIEELAKERNFDPTKDRKSAQLAALDTRKAKAAELPLDILRQEWMQQLQDAGLSATFDSSSGVMIASNPAAVAGMVAVAFENDAVLSWPRLLGSIAEQSQCDLAADEIEAIFREELPAHINVLTGRETPLSDRQVSTPAMLDLEKRLVRAALEGRRAWSSVPDEQIEAAIAEHRTLSDEQAAAVRHALNGDAIALVEGAAGSGKSYMLGVVAATCRNDGCRVIVTAPSWSATNVLAKDTMADDDDKRALAGLLLDIENDLLKLDRDTVVLLDEAGMVPTADMARLVNFITTAGAKLICSGDTKQLQPVGAGAPLRLLARTLGTSRISQIRRQKLDWCRAASMDFASGQTAKALANYDFHKDIEWCRSAQDTISGLTDRYVSDLLWDREANHSITPTALVIASYNEDVLALNAEIRSKLQAASLISGNDSAVPIMVRPRRGPGQVSSIKIAVGDRIAFGETINLPERRLRNADIATVIGLEDGQLILKFERDGQVLSATPSDLVGFRRPDEPRNPWLRHAYAVTTHFSQGMTVDRAYIAALRPMSRATLYVAMTRHRETAHLYVDTARLTLPPGIGAADNSLLRLKKRFFEESQRAAEKLNASDFADDLEEWSSVLDESASPTSIYRASSEKTKLQMQRRVATHQRLGATTADAKISGIPNFLYRRLKVDLVASTAGSFGQQGGRWSRIKMQIAKMFAELSRFLGASVQVIGKPHYRLRTRETPEVPVPPQSPEVPSRADAASSMDDGYSL